MPRVLPLEPAPAVPRSCFGGSADIADADDDALRSRKLTALFGPVQELGAEKHAAIAAWLTPAAPGGAKVSDDTERRAAATPKRFRRALADWLFAMAEEKPLLLVVDDAHWSDPTSLETINLLVDECVAARMLLIIATRPVGPTRWTAARLDDRAAVARPEVALSWRSWCFRAPALPWRTLERVVESAAGDPLFLEELVRHAREIGDAGRHPGLGINGVPLTIKSLLQTRFDTLGPAKRVTQAAAVCGRSSRHDVFEGMRPSDAGSIWSKASSAFARRRSFTSVAIRRARCTPFAIRSSPTPPMPRRP